MCAQRSCRFWALLFVSQWTLLTLNPITQLSEKSPPVKLCEAAVCVSFRFVRHCPRVKWHNSDKRVAGAALQTL